MYTVVRFFSEDAGVLQHIAAEVSARRPESNPTAHRRFSGVVFDLAKGGDWFEHSTAIRRFVDDFHALIARARSSGTEVVIDVAVDSDDVIGRSLVVFRQDSDWMTALGAQGVAFELSLYSLGPDSSDEER